ncbi:hypothetical protein K4F52_006362 [Lecanicillium sp. MT-2017a]|nr:hypothetical protein K4F52_006362 [Lecanicillium sp. MT-2017a]
MKHSVVASGHNAIASPREGTDAVQRVSKAKLLEERAKKLSNRFGLRISTWEWRLEEVDETVLRTDKPICMRARWTCHRCATAFASFTICPNCDHARCTKCSRFPPEHERPSVDNNLPAGFPDEDEGLMIPDYNWTDAGILLTRPSKTGGQDLILKKPRRRVRRSCHECHTQFSQISKTCQKCGHIRCTDCPREPENKEKYPFGYPGDEFGPNSVPYYECDRCMTLYPAGAEDGTVCTRCGREKSHYSLRAQPRAVERHDPEVLKMIQAKLDALKVNDPGDEEGREEEDDDGEEEDGTDQNVPCGQ